MTPDKIAKSNSESAHQKAFFAYCAVATLHGFAKADLWAGTIESVGGSFSVADSKPIPGLEWIFHIPNGGSRGDDKTSRGIRGANLKAEGVREGVWDIMWPLKSVQHSGLWIEMKKPSIKPKRATSAGGVSEAQTNFGNFVYNQGYRVFVCYSWKEAVEALKIYYNECLLPNSKAVL